MLKKNFFSKVWVGMFFIFPTSFAFAWDSHDFITKEALVDQASLQKELVFEPIEAVLKSLSVHSTTPHSRKEFCQLIQVNEEKIEWDKTPKNGLSIVAVLMEATMEVDRGMDQNLRFSDDQIYMGGYTGPSSQASRHMYYEAYTFSKPLLTLHFPFKQMGFAHERAQTYFDLAVQAKKAGHLYWAYRFLGYGLHYIEDISQPYHANQFASLKILPFRTLLTKGWAAFISDTTRLVANFHMSFENYVDLFFVQQSTEAARMVVTLRAPVGDQELKVKLEQQGKSLTISDGVVAIAATSAEMVRDLVSEQIRLYGDRLFSTDVDYLLDRKIDILQTDLPDRSDYHHLIQQCLSNTGVAVRWYVDRFFAE